jgi:hypothetical protein
VQIVELPQGLYEKNKKLHMDYVDYHKMLSADVNQKMSQTTQPAYLFGAHVFAQYLLEMGLNTDKIVNLLENAPPKQGRRLYGTKLNVASPKVLADVKYSIVILKAGVYNDEINKDILDNINNSTQFSISLSPPVRVSALAHHRVVMPRSRPAHRHPRQRPYDARVGLSCRGWWRRTDQVERDLAQQREILWGVVLSQSARIFAQDDIQNPMKPVSIPQCASVAVASSAAVMTRELM